MQEAQTSGGRGIPRLEMPARLVLATSAGNEISPVFELLAGAGLEREGRAGRTRLPGLVDAFEPGDLDSIPDWLAANTDAHLLLLFNAPMPLMARNMADGLAPDRALEKWLADATAILQIVRRYRRQLSLFSLEAVLANPTGFVDLLTQRLGIDLVAPVARHDDRPVAPGALYRMMAENAVWQSNEARNVAAELEANALPLKASPEVSMPTVDEVYREFSQTIEREKTRKAELEEENELLLQQLHQVQEELESTFQKMQELQQSLEKEKTARQAAEKSKEQQMQVHDDEATAKAEARIRDLEEENELLLQQLHHVQEELESYFLSGTDARQELEEARATIEALCSSKSWKITRPLRWFLEKFMGAEKAIR